MPYRPNQYRPPGQGPRPPRHAARVEASGFYSARAWVRLRAAFILANPLCTACLARDVVTASDTVHHKVERLADPSLSLDWGNLEALCKSCHSSLHKRKHR